MRLAAGLRPDPLGELKRSPEPLAVNRGLGKGVRKGSEREGEGKEREGRDVPPMLEPDRRHC